MDNNKGKIFEIPKWEYKKIELDDTKELSELGKKGWEAVGLDAANCPNVLLKRQIGTVRLMEVPKEQSPANNRDGGYSGY